MDRRQRLIILLILGLAVLSFPLIIPVVFDPDYYQAIGEQIEWTPAPTDEPTDSPTLSPQLTQIPVVNSQSSSAGEKQNCTYTALYWTYHPELWHAQVIIGDFNYTKEEATQVLSMNPQEASVILFIQLNAAFLNIVYGANPNDVDQIMVDASNWLLAHPMGSTPSQADLQTGLELANILEEYNTGAIGPGLCEDELLVQLPTQTPDLTLTSAYSTLMAEPPTATITPTSTPTQVVATAWWTSTPTKEKKPDKPKPTNPPPTAEPTRPPPTQPPPTQPPPTQPPPPTSAPTDPPPEPTSAPG